MTSYCMLLALGSGLDGQLLLRRSLLSSCASRAMASVAPSRLLLTIVLAGDLVVLGSRLDHVDDLVVLQGQLSRDCSGLLSAKDVVDPDALGLDQLAMSVVVRGRRSSETRVVIAPEAVQECVPSDDR